MSDHVVKGNTKRLRNRLAKADLWMELATTAQGWANNCKGIGSTPMSEWDEDDPFVQLTVTYDLTPSDLAKLLDGIADQLETRAMNAGYDETWDKRA